MPRYTFGETYQCIHRGRDETQHNCLVCERKNNSRCLCDFNKRCGQGHIMHKSCTSLSCWEQETFFRLDLKNGCCDVAVLIQWSLMVLCARTYHLSAVFKGCFSFQICAILENVPKIHPSRFTVICVSPFFFHTGQDIIKDITVHTVYKCTFYNCKYCHSIYYSSNQWPPTDPACSQS